MNQKVFKHMYGRARSFSKYISISMVFPDPNSLVGGVFQRVCVPSVLLAFYIWHFSERERAPSAMNADISCGLFCSPISC
jgi:hypothetical protein